MNYISQWEEQVMHKAIDHYGVEKQMCMVMEECCELAAEVNHYQRGGDENRLIGEIADVSIMLDQIILMIDGINRVASARMDKLRRLRARIEREQAQELVSRTNSDVRATGFCEHEKLLLP